jgi:S-ribosylhomocysteine lyase
MRSGEAGDRVIYVGPMGCRTGFYLLMSGGTERNAENFAALCTAFDNILAHEGKMPGAARKECGNFRALSLKAAKDEAKKYIEVLDEFRRAGTLPTFEYEGGRSGI